MSARNVMLQKKGYYIELHLQKDFCEITFLDYLSPLNMPE